ncbi:glycosyltransferase [Luteolibacter sp. SL250]|uniref:glycosyltransferase family 2 protein n=1 Tax=Luteolibacter sp. SL250 TaxID=2995170 RepID=UPI00226E3121|nr:glycosyltransferase [Luteolibacter sp. SL250]WAC20877.1 glycosyltransferase [Luteolibacter sp. SL250]
MELLYPGFEAFVWTVGLLILTLQTFQNGIYIVQLFGAVPEFLRARRRSSRLREWWLLTSDVTPPVTLLVPGYNEQETIVESVRSLLTLQYPELEIIVVNDGSKDGTLQRLIEAFELSPLPKALPRRVGYKPVRGIYGTPRLPGLIVIDKENGGKADALNAALDVAKHPLVCSVDADSLLDSEALLRAVRPFIDEPEETVAVGGTIRVVNGSRVRAGQVEEVRAPRGWVELFQSVEYVRAFLMARMAWTRSRTVTIISGAFGVFNRHRLLQMGGYAHGTVGEDMELVVRMYRHASETGAPMRVWHVPDPVCWTEAPDSLKILARQRTRWQRGLCETLWRHRTMIGSPRYGSVGMSSMPQFLFFDVVSPVLEMVGLLLVPLCTLAGILSIEFFFAYCAVVFGFGISLSLGSFVLSEFVLRRHGRAVDLWWMGLGAIVENLGYRQLNSFWRVMGIWQFLKGKQGWGDMQRKGFQVRPNA